MKAKLVIPRELANHDVEQAVEYYLTVDEKRAASNFVNALGHAYELLAHHSATGSPRYAHELNLAGLRAWPLKKFPYIIFYVECEEHIDIWRVLHSHRDIPKWLL